MHRSIAILTHARVHAHNAHAGTHNARTSTHTHHTHTRTRTHSRRLLGRDRARCDEAFLWRWKDVDASRSLALLCLHFLYCLLRAHNFGFCSCERAQSGALPYTRYEVPSTRT